MNVVLERLRQGVRNFRTQVYPLHADAYQLAAATPQEPHTLMITCADSRIDIETITQSPPGNLFVMRNVGNIVPAYGEMMGGVSAVVEYAVSALHVKHVVICGHSDCGAMKALLQPGALEALPTVRNWLINAHAAEAVARGLTVPDDTPDAMLTRITERNVLLQLQHLKTHPSVALAMARSELTVSGWVYDIATGGVRIAEDGTAVFEAV